MTNMEGSCLLETIQLAMGRVEGDQQLAAAALRRQFAASQVWGKKVIAMCERCESLIPFDHLGNLTLGYPPECTEKKELGIVVVQPKDRERRIYTRPRITVDPDFLPKAA